MLLLEYNQYLSEMEVLDTVNVFYPEYLES